MPTISEIETALVARLALRNQKREEGNAASIAATDADNIVRANVGKDPLPYSLLPVVRNIAGYGGQLESEEALAQVYSMAPAIWVTYEGETATQRNSEVVSQLTMAVFVLAHSYSPEQLRRGGHKLPGLYQLIEIVKGDLTNQSCGIGITPLAFVSVVPLWRGGPQGGGWSLATVRFTTEKYETFEADVDYLCAEPIYVADWNVKALGLDAEVKNIIKPWETPAAPQNSE